MTNSKQTKQTRPKKQFNWCSPTEFYKIYSYFLKEVFKEESPPFSNKTKNTYNSFCKSCHDLVGDSVGINFIVDYFSFTFGKLIGKELANPISFSFICNKPQLRAFLERSDQHNYVINQMTDKVNKFEVKSWFFKKAEEGYNPEMPEKKQNLLLCFLTGVLYDSKDQLCTSCHYRQECSKF